VIACYCCDYDNNDNDTVINRLPGMRLQTKLSKTRRLSCRTSSVLRPGGQRLSCEFSISSVTMAAGQPESTSARLMTDCRTESGVEIMPPQRVTRVNCSAFTHLKAKNKSQKVNLCIGQ